MYVMSVSIVETIPAGKCLILGVLTLTDFLYNKNVNCAPPAAAAKCQYPVTVANSHGGEHVKLIAAVTLANAPCPLPHIVAVYRVTASRTAMPQVWASSFRYLSLGIFFD